MEKYRNANELCDRMSIVRQLEKWPNCEEILEKKHLWALSSSELEFGENLNNTLEPNDQNDDFSIESNLWFDWGLIVKQMIQTLIQILIESKIFKMHFNSSILWVNDISDIGPNC